MVTFIGRAGHVRVLSYIGTMLICECVCYVVMLRIEWKICLCWRYWFFWFSILQLRALHSPSCCHWWLISLCYSSPPIIYDRSLTNSLLLYCKYSMIFLHFLSDKKNLGRMCITLVQIFVLVIQSFFFLFSEVHVDNEEPYIGDVDSLIKHSDNSWFDRYHTLSLLLIIFMC
jgi:hypothetical protein